MLLRAASQMTWSCASGLLGIGFASLIKLLADVAIGEKALVTQSVRQRQSTMTAI